MKLGLSYEMLFNSGVAAYADELTEKSENHSEALLSAVALMIEMNNDALLTHLTHFGLIPRSSE